MIMVAQDRFKLVGRGDDKRKLYGSMTRVFKDRFTLARLRCVCKDMCDNGGGVCVEIGYFKQRDFHV